MSACGAISHMHGCCCNVGETGGSSGSRWRAREWRRACSGAPAPVPCDSMFCKDILEQMLLRGSLNCIRMARLASDWGFRLALCGANSLNCATLHTVASIESAASEAAMATSFSPARGLQRLPTAPRPLGRLPAIVAAPVQRGTWPTGRQPSAAAAAACRRCRCSAGQRQPGGGEPQLSPQEALLAAVSEGRGTFSTTWNIDSGPPCAAS